MLLSVSCCAQLGMITWLAGLLATELMLEHKSIYKVCAPLHLSLKSPTKYLHDGVWYIITWILLGTI